MQAPQSACDKPLVATVPAASLFGAPAKCATAVRRDAFPHTCGVCHGMVKGIRCSSKATGKGVYCEEHKSLAL
jgi:hypothetical protein